MFKILGSSGANDNAHRGAYIHLMPQDNDFRLTQDQIDFFHEEGYLAVDALTTPDDVAMLREQYDRIFAERAGRAEGNQFDLTGTDEEGKDAALPQILNPAKYAPQMRESLLLKNATIAGRQLLGDEAECNIFHAIYKPPRSGAETPWHQDAAYWEPHLFHRSISIWVPLQEATLDNGCMQFVPRSHRYDIVDHQSINDDPRIHGLEFTPTSRLLLETANVVSCPLPPGGATFHGGYMFHHTPPNRSDVPRRALILGAALKATPRQMPRRFAWLERQRTARQARIEAAGMNANT